MNGFHTRGLWFSHQWPRKTRQKKIAKSVVGKSIALRMLRHASDVGPERQGSSGSLQRSQPPFQEPAFGVVRRQRERSPVRLDRVVGPTGTAEKVGLRRMEQVITIQVRLEGLEHPE